MDRIFKQIELEGGPIEAKITRVVEGVTAIDCVDFDPL